MVKHRSRNFTYRAALKNFGSDPKMEINPDAPRLRGALKELYTSKYTEIVFNIDC
jgi:hypothetical protein